jgi:rod shape-determining protein MreB
VLPGILPGNGARFFADEAIAQRRYLDLRWPMTEGIVRDLDTARDFVRHVRGIVNGTEEVWAVVGTPARTSPAELESMRDAMGSNFARFLIAPEPFLAALGLRDETRVEDPKYRDPVRNSIVVDIGAGTTDLCILQGFFPTENDQSSFPKAGNNVDVKLRELIEQKYPDVKLHNVSVTRVKEENSYVGKPDKKVTLEVLIHGKPRTLDVTELIGKACEILVAPIVDAATDLAKRVPQEIADLVLGNIILTGGGSQIAGLPEAIQKRLNERGIVSARVTRADNYKKLVAEGGLKVARMMRDDQWQHPSLSA